jgi:hypothetical protein
LAVPLGVVLQIVPELFFVLYGWDAALGAV